MTTQETGTVTGTKDKDYNLIWYVEACLGNALRLETLHPGRRPRGRDGQATAAFAARFLTGFRGRLSAHPAIPGLPARSSFRSLLRTGWALGSVTVHGHLGEASSWPALPVTRCRGPRS